MANLNGRVVRTIGSSSYPVSVTGTANHNFERVYYQSKCTSGDVRGKYEDLEFTTTGSGETLRLRGIVSGASGATGGTINALHATGRVASASATVSGAMNAIRATLEVAGTTPTPGGTLAALQLDSNIVTGATMGANDAFVRVTDSGATALGALLNFANCTSGTGNLHYGSTLKCIGPSGAKYIVLSDAENSITGVTTMTGITTLGGTNIDAGASGTAGTVDIFPTTASKGKITLQCTDNTTNHNLTITNAALNGANKTATFPAVTGYVAESTAALTLAEVDVLDGATAGTPVASKAVVADANQNIGVVRATELRVGATGAEVAIASTPAQIDAAVAGTPLVYRTNVTTALINAGATAVVPAVAGQKFQVMQIMMRANGGNASGATTVAVTEETAGTVFLSHVVADLTDGAWNNHVNGTPVITGITAGGTTGTANKALLATKSGGDLATATSVDFIVVGFYTTT